MRRYHWFIFLKENNSLVLPDYWDLHPPPGGTSLKWGLYFFGHFPEIIFWPALSHLWTWWNSVPCSPVFHLSRPENDIGTSVRDRLTCSHIFCLRQRFLAEDGTVPSPRFGHFRSQGRRAPSALGRIGDWGARMLIEPSAVGGWSRRTWKHPHLETLSLGPFCDRHW